MNYIAWENKLMRIYLTNIEKTKKHFTDQSCNCFEKICAIQSCNKCLILELSFKTIVYFITSYLR